MIGTGSVSGIGINKLIYAAIISEVVTTEEYSINPRFEVKKPKDTNAKTRRGDNIYYKINNEWKQLENNFHGEYEFESDLSSERILICDDFWYFGNQAPLIPQEFLGIIKEKQGIKYTDDKVVVNNFIAWLKTFKQGELGSPSSLDNTFQAA
ncbi:hypothetical protein [Alysiella crassa]|uniref:Nmad2 family putative nucleotide modification protein n=1 Tax=Alysiella crassa TaxID=153491 RepID=UPI00319E7209